MALKSCKITKKLEALCDTNVAGVSSIAFANWDEDIASKFTTDGSGCTISTIADVKFYELEVADGTAYATADVTVGANADSKYVMHTVGGAVNRVSCEFLAEAKQWMLASVIAAVRTKNGEVYVYGLDNGLRASTFTLGTGTAEGDQSGLTFVFDGTQTDAPKEVASWSIIKATFE